MFYNDRRFIYLILAILIIMNLMGMSQYDWLILLLTIPGVLVAITFHEYAHAYVATKLGDDTPLIQGRLSLNPFKHIDAVGFALLLFCRIWMGKTCRNKSKKF